MSRWVACVRQPKWPLLLAVAFFLLAGSIWFIVEGNRLFARGRWFRAGEVRVDSGSLLLSDPWYLPDELASLSVRVEGVPVGSWPVDAWRQAMPEGGERVMRMRVTWGTGTITKRRALGDVGVDSALVAAIDPAEFAREWVEVGPLRQGVLGGLDQEKLADLLRAQGFSVGTGDRWSIPLLDPVSIVDEALINKLIKDNGLRAMLMIRSGNTLDRLLDRLGIDDWADLSHADGSPGLIVACSSGYGDGLYPAYGLYHGSSLVGVEVQFD